MAESLLDFFRKGRERTCWSVCGRPGKHDIPERKNRYFPWKNICGDGHSAQPVARRGGRAYCQERGQGFLFVSKKDSYVLAGEAAGSS